MGRYVSRVEELLRIVESVLSGGEGHRVHLSGTTNMLIQPEFKDVEKVKSILDILEQTPTLVKMFSNAPAGIQVRIGSENNLEAINDCSLITATYSIDNQVLGTIGILGPTRMEYAKVITVLEHLTKQLAENLQRWYK
jgi:heat-inducible transcriptional repressor